ncbi:MAG: DNA polymerase III subunit delta [Sphingomonas sanxanigenens]|uniref:DNA-directed DNA polymerase n=1 Tax=Sphingomonas sanxanigenens TaxID=397260 RepID=A0A2W5CCK0_9SPHN|nr:MAG: DNA polymerase III subunit delta [Sphingomonas sanxanigenens]
MKASRGQIERALDKPGGDVRFFLLHGPDESGSAALADRLARAMGADAEKVEIDGATLASDPARLPDEAASISLFGGPRFIRLRLTADEAADAVAALLGAEAAGNPVVAVAGALKPASRLLKLALADPAALCFASYAPEGEDANRLAMAIGRDLGLRIAPDIGRRLVDATGGDRAVLTREIEKLALFLDAAPERPGEASHEALDRIGADMGEVDLSDLVDAVLSGQPAEAAHEIERLDAAGALNPQTLRAFQRRLSLLIQIRGAIDAGATAEDAMASAGKALFWKDKPAVARQLRLWDSARLARLNTRLLDADRQLKSSQSAGSILAAAELIAVSRAAARAR